MSPIYGETLEELHQKALKEGGSVNFYGTLAQVTAAKILSVFEKRFPGIKINQIDATPDKLAARAIAEARGGRTLGDVFQTQLENIVQLHEQGLLLERLPPEADAYPENFKGSYWLATEFDYIIGAWNKNLLLDYDLGRLYQCRADQTIEVDGNQPHRVSGRKPRVGAKTIA
jgi:hypothetical protein